MEISLDAALSDTFRGLCRERGITQETVVRATGWSQSQVSHLWRGARRWKVFQAEAAARILELPGGPAQLLGLAAKHASNEGHEE